MSPQTSCVSEAKIWISEPVKLSLLSEKTYVALGNKWRRLIMKSPESASH